MAQPRKPHHHNSSNVYIVWCADLVTLELRFTGSVGDVEIARKLVWVTDDSLDDSMPEGRRGRIAGFKLSTINNLIPNPGSVAAPATISVATVDGDPAVFDVDVKASSLFYDPDRATGETLWIGEFHSPATQANTKVTERPKLAGASCGLHSRAAATKVTGPHAACCMSRQEGDQEGCWRQSSQQQRRAATAWRHAR